MTHSDSTKPLWIFDLNSNRNDSFIGSTPSFTTMIDTTHKALIDLNDSGQLLSFTPYHSNTILVKHFPCSTIACA